MKYVKPIYSWEDTVAKLQKAFPEGLLQYLGFKGYLVFTSKILPYVRLNKMTRTEAFRVLWMEEIPISYKKFLRLWKPITPPKRRILID